MNPTDPLKLLRTRFALDAFRPGQHEVIADILSGRDVLCVMPTGAGKSLCYQLPAVAYGGLTVVVSPLISLMEDQVSQLRDRGIPAMYLNSSLSNAQQRQALGAVADTAFAGLLYIAPERLAMPGFREAVQRRGVAMLAVDEAHCVSQWGHDFRPEYSRIGEFRAQIGDPPTVALTATATEDVRADIIRMLHLRSPGITITGFDRSNLGYESVRTPSKSESMVKLQRLLKDERGSVIIYCSTRKAVEELASTLHQKFAPRSVIAYHAGMDMAARESGQRLFMGTPGAVVVATNAFGMGINKPDVRLVCHYNLPGTLEAYYQEAGRAGRDGRPARCVLLYKPSDRETQRFFIERIGQDGGLAQQQIAQLKKHAGAKLELMIQYAAGHRCRRQMILDYFGDMTEVENCGCDVCQRGEPAAAEVNAETTTLVRQLLSGIARLNGRFGVGAVADLLSGSDAERVRRLSLDRLPTFGVLRHYDRGKIRRWLDLVLEVGLARQLDPDRNFRPVVELTPVGVAVMKGQRQPPGQLAGLLEVDNVTGPRGSSPGEPRRKARRVTDVSHLDDPAQQRFDRLRAIRAELAREKSVPPYVVCHDTTLRLIASLAPASLEELADVKGMGPLKVSMYGQKLLDALL